MPPTRGRGRGRGRPGPAKPENNGTGKDAGGSKDESADQKATGISAKQETVDIREGAKEETSKEKTNIAKDTTKAATNEGTSVTKETPEETTNVATDIVKDTAEDTTNKETTATTEAQEETTKEAADVLKDAAKVTQETSEEVIEQEAEVAMETIGEAAEGASDETTDGADKVLDATDPEEDIEDTVEVIAEEEGNETIESEISAFLGEDGAELKADAETDKDFKDVKIEITESLNIKPFTLVHSNEYLWKCVYRGVRLPVAGQFMTPLIEKINRQEMRFGSYGFRKNNQLLPCFAKGFLVFDTFEQRAAAASSLWPVVNRTGAKLKMKPYMKPPVAIAKMYANGENCLHLNNVPENTTIKQLKALYPKAQEMYIPVGKSGKSLGYAVLYFKSKNVAEAVQKYNKDVMIGTSVMSLQKMYISTEPPAEIDDGAETAQTSIKEEEESSPHTAAKQSKPSPGTPQVPEKKDVPENTSGQEDVHGKPTGPSPAKGGPSKQTGPAQKSFPRKQSGPSQKTGQQKQQGSMKRSSPINKQKGQGGQKFQKGQGPKGGQQWQKGQGGQQWQKNQGPGQQMQNRQQGQNQFNQHWQNKSGGANQPGIMGNFVSGGREQFSPTRGGQLYGNERGTGNQNFDDWRAPASHVGSRDESGWANRGRHQKGPRFSGSRDGYEREHTTSRLEQPAIDVANIGNIDKLQGIMKTQLQMMKQEMEQSLKMQLMDELREIQAAGNKRKQEELAYQSQNVGKRQRLAGLFDTVGMGHDGYERGHAASMAPRGSGMNIYDRPPSPVNIQRNSHQYSGYDSLPSRLLSRSLEDNRSSMGRRGRQPPSPRGMQMTWGGDNYSPLNYNTSRPSTAGNQIYSDYMGNYSGGYN